MTLYSKQQPFLASIKERYSLCKAGSQKNTQHIVLDLTGSGLNYEVGDSIGIYPCHDSKLIEKTLLAARLSGHEVIQLKSGEEMALNEALINRLNVTTVSPKLFREVQQLQTDKLKQEQLAHLQQDEQREALKRYLQQHEVWDFLQENEEVQFSAQEFVNLLMPLLPRFYSISSSQKCVGEEVHLTIAPVAYESNGHWRQGVCTHYLCDMVELNDPVVPVFIQPSHGFRLPADPSVALIMIGPGTGIAPFRAFLQERFHHHRSSAKHWLFFGEWNRQSDFFYEEEWLSFGQLGHLEIEVAFSRDQESKIYVQHKMEEKGALLYQWLEEDSAYLYVCGDAQRMAKDVELQLQRIIELHGKKEASEAREYIKRLRQQKRYLRDVY